MAKFDENIARKIWETSRKDEGTISATGANIIAAALEPLIRERERFAWTLGQHAGLDDYERNDGTLSPNYYRD